MHARGSGAHGYFQAYGDLSDLTRAAFLCDPGIETPVFARFSTVAGGAGSVDLLDNSGGAIACIDVAKKGRLWPRAAVIKA